MIDIMIVGEHAIIREKLKNLIEFDENIRVVAEAGNGRECVNKLSLINPDILLFDINMLKANGMEALELICRRKKRPKILMLAVRNEIEYLISAIDIGVEGYILENFDSRELIKTIKYLYKGNRFVRPSLISFLNSKSIVGNIYRDKLNLLSKREIELLRLIASGFTNREISDKLCISEYTVKNHLSNIFKKINCADRTQAAIFSIRSKLVDINDYWGCSLA